MPDKSESKKRKAPVYKLSEAMNVEIIVLDEPNSGGRSSRRFGLDSYHNQKNRGFGDFATRYMDCKVTKLSMPENSKPEDVRPRILEALQCKSSDDLVILFYDGAAFDKGTELYWKFENYPKGRIGAYQILQGLVDSGNNVLTILDCWCPNRFDEKLKPRNKDADQGNFEIFAKGADVPIELGQENGFDDGGFTLDLIEYLVDFVDNIHKPASQGGYAGWMAPLSWSHLLRRNKDFARNPIRIFDKQPRANHQTLIERFVMDPKHIRRTGKISFFKRTIQEPKEDDQDECADSPIAEDPEDEGFCEESVEGPAEGSAEGSSPLFVPENSKLEQTT